MTRKIYEAMKRHVTKITPENEVYRSIIEDYRTMDFSVVWGVPFYHFNADRLNQGLSEFDEEYIDGFIWQTSTHNLWNVCQRFHAILSRNYPHFDERLLAATNMV